MSGRASPDERCEKCGKPTTICVCDRIQQVKTKTRVLVLQHPREDDKVLGTASLLPLMLDSCVVQRGLSWASLSDALGESADPKDFGVLYPMSLKKPLSEAELKAPYLVINRHGDVETPAPKLRGIVALDGTWSQGKSLWWRNPWLLKLHRIVLSPREPSIYGKLRKEPRRAFVSTLEAVADVLVENGEPATTREEMRRVFRTMVQRARENKPRRTRVYDVD